MKCARCNHKIDACTSIRELGAEPKDGDFSICAYCGDLAIFESGTLRELKESDIDKFDPGFLLELQFHQRMLKLFHKKDGKAGV